MHVSVKHPVRRNDTGCLNALQCLEIRLTYVVYWFLYYWMLCPLEEHRFNCYKAHNKLIKVRICIWNILFNINIFYFNSMFRNIKKTNKNTCQTLSVLLIIIGLLKWHRNSLPGADLKTQSSIRHTENVSWGLQYFQIHLSLSRWSWKYWYIWTSSLTTGISASMIRTLRRSIKQWALCFSMTHQSMQKIPISRSLQYLLHKQKKTLSLLPFILQ